MQPIISGIQQIGIGVTDATEAFTWYRQHFGMDILMFDDVAEASLMKHYTGGQVHKRRAILALNLKGGAGLEIWQYKNRIPLASPSLLVGDTGISSVKIKSANIHASFQFLKNKKTELLSGITKTPEGKEHFFCKDLYGNQFEIVQSKNWFSENHFHVGGPVGCTIGVRAIDVSRKFYSEILQYDQVIYEQEGYFDDLAELPGGKNKVRRVLLKHSHKKEGAFSQLLGDSEIELIQVLDRIPKKIYENRYWGDRGFIHICFDIYGMDLMKKTCAHLGHPFTSDSSSSFGMGQAAGHFSYIEDPDGTLIEFVETHRIPIAKKIGWYLDLRKRNPKKPLPSWMLRALRFNRVND
jgi:catechol 2,3-dioxygenase-like lactoylglutathione lyase family enzyme